MFGTNPTRKVDPYDSGKVLHVQGEPFATIQGEGPYAGLPATFIRLWGCHLKCLFCDTDFETDPQAWSIDRLINRCGSQLVVLTGGEPLRQNVAPLISALIDAGKIVQVETAGNLWWESLNALDFTIVCSPKTPAVHGTLRKRVQAWKYIITDRDCDLDAEDGLPIMNTQQADGRLHRLARPPIGTPAAHVWVQPMDEQVAQQNAANTLLCVKLAQVYGYRVSLQLHKILGLP